MVPWTRPYNGVLLTKLVVKYVQYYQSGFRVIINIYVQQFKINLISHRKSCYPDYSGQEVGRKFSAV